MHFLLQDFRHALRQLRRGPGFTVIAVLTLALGICTSTVVFAVMSSVLLRPLPFPNPDRLVRIFSTENGNATGPSPLDGRDFDAENRTFEKVVVCDSWRKNVSPAAGTTEPEQLEVGLVPAEYFEILGVKPLMGRLFTAEENRWGNHYEAILSYDLWQTRYGGDRAVLGKSIRINDEPYTIVGVMPSGDLGPTWWLDGPHQKVQLWTPFVPYLRAGGNVWAESQRGERGWYAMGRLKPGVTLPQAQADLKQIADSLAARYPLDRGVGVTLRPLQEDRAANLRPAILLLMGAVLFILLIACSNIVNLLLARNYGRTRDIAVRMALGAKRSALVRQFMTENLTLGLLGGTLGCAGAWFGCAAVARFHPMTLPQLGSVSASVPVMAFGLGLAVASSVVFGTLPAFAGLRVAPAEAFREGGRSNLAGRRTQWVRQCLIAAEMALALMLLIGTGLLLQSLLQLQQQQPGFRVDHVLRTHMFAPPVRYPDAASRTRLFDEYAAGVRRLPGVQEATISAAYPPADNWKQSFSLSDAPAQQLEALPSATFNVTDAHYLPTLGIPLLKGRDFRDSDGESTPSVALINDAFARRYFAGQDPVGRDITMHFQSLLPGDPVSTVRYTIIGVMGDVMNRGVTLPPDPQITVLFRQTPQENSGFENLMVRTTLPPMELAPAIRRQLQSLDPNLPFAEVATMDEIMAEQTIDRRYTAALLGFFATFGMALAGIGVYGVISYMVAQRTREIGLRMALGAERTDVLWLVTRQGLVTAGLGAAAGLFGAWFLRQAIAPLVFGISAADPKTLLGSAALLIALAGIASYLPARRAAMVDPMIALRYE